MRSDDEADSETGERDPAGRRAAAEVRPALPGPGVSPATLLLAAILGLLAFHTLRVARPLLLPIALAVLASFVLRPLVRAGVRRGAPEPLAAAVVVLVLLSAGGAALVALSGPAARWVERAPTTLREIERRVRPIRAPVERIARATQEVEEATAIEDAPGHQVQVSEGSLFSDVALQARGFVVGLLATVVLLFFLLARGDRVARRLPEAARAPPARISREMFQAMESEISRHLLTISAINLALGVIVGLALLALGMPNAALWGAMAALLNYIPFLGAMAGTLVVGGVALISFDEPGRAVAVSALYAFLTGIEGMVVTPAILGRRLTLSPVAVFVSLMLWSFVWGVPGALIAVPALAVTKIVADRVTPLRGVGRWLGGG